MNVCVEVIIKMCKPSNCFNPRYLLVLMAKASLAMRMIHITFKEAENKMMGTLLTQEFVILISCIKSCSFNCTAEMTVLWMYKATIVRAKAEAAPVNI